MIVRAAFVLGSALELQEDGRLAAGDLDGTDILCRYGRHCVLLHNPLTSLQCGRPLQQPFLWCGCCGRGIWIWSGNTCCARRRFG